MKWTPEHLRLFRKGENLTQVELAKIVGVAQRTLQDWENGKTRIPMPVANLLNFVELSKKALRHTLSYHQLIDRMAVLTHVRQFE